MAIFVKTAPSASTDNVIQPTGPTIIPLIIRGAVGQTANLTEWQDSNSVVNALVNVDPATLAIFYVTRTSVNVSGTTNAIRGDATAAPASAPAANTSYRGIQAFANTLAGMSSDMSAAGVNLVALNAVAQHAANVNLAILRGVQVTANHQSAATVALSHGLSTGINNTGGGVITTGVGFNIAAPGASGGSTYTNVQGIDVQNQGNALIANSFGIRIRAQSGSTVQNVGLMIDGGRNQFNASAATQIPLVLQGFAAHSTSIFHVQNSGGGAIFVVGQNTIGAFGATPVGQRVGASAAGIAAIVDANAQAAIAALQAALNTLGFVTAPA